MTWSLSAARDLLARCSQLRDAGRAEAVLRAEFQSRLRSVFPSGADESWVNHYSEGAEAHTRVGRPGGDEVSRFIDTLVHSTVVEYEADLRQAPRWEVGLGQVREYVAGAIRAGTPVSQVRGVLSDTVQWHVFDAELAPGAVAAGCTPADVVLKEVESFVPTSASDQNAERLALFLKNHLAREQSRPLTSEHIAVDLGLDSSRYRGHLDTLLALVNAARSGDTSVALAVDLWSRFVDGLESRARGFRAETYVDEVYIGILARLLAANVLAGRATLSDDGELTRIMNGELFSTRFRLRNMVEDDYFGWLVREPHISSLVPVAREIQRDLYAYDFTRTQEQDLFGRLMAQLARRSQRKLLGQEWTPSWLASALASRCLDSIPDGEPPRIVDMCCGSGSILAEVIAEYRRRRSTATLQELAEVATGFDIDPLAVMLAKTTWVVTLAPLLQSAPADVTIPVFHADSLFAVTPVTGRMPTPGEAADFTIELDGQRLQLPAELVGPELRDVFDDIVDWCYDEARNAVAQGGSGPGEIDADRLLNGLIEKHDITIDERVRGRIAGSAWALARRMSELARANRNGIWAFILRNTYRPGLLAGQFNGLVSNPPWLAMSQFADNPYKEQLSIRAELYGIKPSGASHLHLELATTFLLHATDRYLKPGASVACLLPGTLFNGLHHQKFRDAAYLSARRPVPLAVTEVWEIEPGTFKVRSAAIVGIKKPATEGAGSLPNGFHVGASARTAVGFEVRRLGERSAWVLGGNAAPLGTPVSEAVPPQGADLMPRTAVCVEIVDRSGAEWRVSTPIRGSSLYFAVKDAKKLKDAAFPGLVAPEFLFRMVQSLNLLPFYCALPFASIAIPARRTSGGEWEMLDAGAIRTMGFQQTARRFARIDRAVSESGVVRPFAEKINERSKLVRQVFHPGEFLVLSGAGGGVSCGACLPVEGNEDVVIDQTLYWRVTSSADEAWYLVGLLNSDAITEAIRPFVPQGEFGERHLHTLPHRVTPAFDPRNEDHIRIAELARTLSDHARAATQQRSAIGDPNRPIAARRRNLRQLLNGLPVFQQLEEVAAAVLGTTPADVQPAPHVEPSGERTE